MKPVTADEIAEVTTAMLAERDAARTAQKDCLEIAERATVQRDKAEAIADAWKALAIALAIALAKHIDGTGSMVTTAAAKAALRALGVDPEGT